VKYRNLLNPFINFGFSKMKKVLIIQTAFIGDVILTTPLISRIRESFPQALIDFLTIPSSLNILESNPDLNQLIIFDKTGRDKGIGGLLRTASRLAKENYDVCLVPHRSLRSAILAWKSRAPLRIGFDRSAWKKAFTEIVPYRYNRHEIERNLALLSPLGLKTQISAPSVYATEEDRMVVNAQLNIIESYQYKHLLAVAPGSVWPTKRWPAEKYAALCRILQDYQIITLLIGSQEDADLCRRIGADLRNTLTLAGKLTLRQTYALLTRCSGIITNDSAPLHLGMAAGTRVFAIFGSTVPAFGFAPFGEKAYIMENTTLMCRPCTTHGRKTCPLKTFECMESLQAEAAADLIVSALYAGSMPDLLKKENTRGGAD
jgi:heptosyltransferase II